MNNNIDVYKKISDLIVVLDVQVQLFEKGNSSFTHSELISLHDTIDKTIKDAKEHGVLKNPEYLNYRRDIDKIKDELTEM